MPISSVKIHPAIGVARLGNSPDEFFIGPERRWEPPDPPGGFKDGQCRVKRQAARFRVFAYNDDGSVDEITTAEADITWTVRLANKKAVDRNSGTATALTIDPGARTLDGPNQIREFDTGQITLPGQSAVTVHLGEARTDDDGHLLVLGGHGVSASPGGSPITHFANNAGWYDDIADGPVTAHIRLHASGDEFDADPAWVLVAPPKFAPQIDNVITLHDRVLQMARDQGWIPAPGTPSYTDDVFPILQRARDTRWVVDVFGAHTWPDPVYGAGARVAVFNRLAPPTGGTAGMDMPELQSARLTATQYEVMERWKDDDFTQDWAGLPAPAAAITPDDLDRAALEACVGAAFYPGIEAGGLAQQPVIDPASYVGAGDPLRLDTAGLQAGDMTRYMAVPWQADFYACGYHWWPVPRPNDVIAQGTTSYRLWDSDITSSLGMVADWHRLGFVVRQGSEHVEVDRCAATFITLLTPVLTFQDVPQGPMGMSRKTALAIVFEVGSTGAAVTLEVAPGGGPSHPRLELDQSSVTVGPTVGNEVATARLWLIYETGTVGELITDQITIRNAAATSQTWTVSVSATTAARQPAAAALVLDRSGSMSEDRGDSQSKHQSLKEAASIFVDVMVEGDGVGIVRYNQDAQPLQAVTSLGPAGDPFDTARQDTKDIITGPDLTPGGATSIGDGLFEGRQLLDAAGGGFPVKSLVVLTDGKENRPRWIEDVAGSIDERTYAVGLGTPQNTSAPALQTVSGNNGGYLLVTGPITGDNRFILQKYFLQILAGISNADVVLDPDGALVPGVEQRIPFSLTRADAGVDVILLTPYPTAVDFRVQTPHGFVIEPWRASVEPSMRHVLSQGLAYYRLVLPQELLPARFDHGGTWHALLRIGRPRTTPPRDDVDAGEPDNRRPTGSEGVRFDAERRFTPRRPVAGAQPLVTDVAGPPLEGTVRYAVAEPPQRTLPYSLLVHSYSNLSFRASLRQSDFDPGADVTIGATLAESGIPCPGGHAWAEIRCPDGSARTLPLPERDRGRFSATFATGDPGVYRVRARVSGRTRRGEPFQREQTLTAAVWHGGSRDADPASAGGGPLVRWLDERERALCATLNCFLGAPEVSREVERLVRGAGVDPDRLRRCLRLLCRREGTSEGESPDEPRASALADLIGRWGREPES